MCQNHRAPKIQVKVQTLTLPCRRKLCPFLEPVVRSALGQSRMHPVCLECQIRRNPNRRSHRFPYSLRRSLLLPLLASLVPPLPLTPRRCRRRLMNRQTILNPPRREKLSAFSTNHQRVLLPRPRLIPILATRLLRVLLSQKVRCRTSSTSRSLQTTQLKPRPCSITRNHLWTSSVVTQTRYLVLRRMLSLILSLMLSLKQRLMYRMRRLTRISPPPPKAQLLTFLISRLLQAMRLTPRCCPVARNQP